MQKHLAWLPVTGLFGALATANAQTPPPFRALREPDRRRRDEERLSRSEQRTDYKPKSLLDRKSPIQVRIPLPPAESPLRTRLSSVERRDRWGMGCGLLGSAAASSSVVHSASLVQPSRI